MPQRADDAAHRVSFLAAILLCIGLAASASRALSGSSTGFVIAFASLRGPDMRQRPPRVA